MATWFGRDAAEQAIKERLQNDAAATARRNRRRIRDAAPLLAEAGERRQKVEQMASFAILHECLQRFTVLLHIGFHRIKNGTHLVLRKLS
jgi:hypothetical protein